MNDGDDKERERENKTLQPKVPKTFETACNKMQPIQQLRNSN
jgi:hypothetical protein